MKTCLKLVQNLEIFVSFRLLLACSVELAIEMLQVELLAVSCNESDSGKVVHTRAV